MKKFLGFVFLFMFLTLTLVGCNEEKEEKTKENNLVIKTDVVDGYTFDEATNIYTINLAGEYELSGNLEGRIVCSDKLTQKVTLVLNGVNITSSNSVIYWSSESSKIEIKAKENSVNTLTVTNALGKENSVIESENNLELGGKGTLNIVANQKHAVKASEITIKGSVILNVEAVKDAFHAKAITVLGGNLNIENCNDAFEAELNSKGNKGTIVINGGIIKIKNCNYAFKSETSVTIKVGFDTDGITLLNLKIELTNTELVTISSTNDIDVSNGIITINGVDYNNK